MQEKVYRFPVGAAGPPHMQALRELIERCIELGEMYPEEVARRINEFHIDLISRPREERR